VALAQGASAGETALKSAVLSSKLSAALKGQAMKMRAAAPDKAIKGLTDWIENSFQEWKGLATIVGVMGTGRVATFAPPYVPVGPVVAGDNMSTGPVFAGPRFGKVVL
jgi:hypothetical protein